MEVVENENSDHFSLAGEREILPSSLKASWIHGSFALEMKSSA